MKFDLLLRWGFSICDLIDKAQELMEVCHQKYFLFKLSNQYEVNLSRKKILEHKKNLINFIKYKIKEINELIINCNKIAKKINPKFQIKRLTYTDLNKKISHFFQIKSEVNKELMPYVINSFDYLIYIKLKPLYEQLSNIRDTLDSEIDSFKIDKINIKYQNSLNEVIDLYFMDYKSTSLLVLGRIFEEIITKYLLKLKKDKKIDISKKEILEKRFENKLGLLKSKGFVSEKDWLIISKLRFDRNVGGHFIENKIKKESESESEPTIKLALKLINKYDKKLKAKKK